jgi:hypothetical protein
MHDSHLGSITNLKKKILFSEVGTDGELFWGRSCVASQFRGENKKGEKKEIWMLANHIWCIW